jgi:hypothetical protein
VIRRKKMTDDFTIYQGVDVTPYFVVNDNTGNPVDLAAWSAATWVADPMDSTNPVIIKHQAAMTLGTDPEDTSDVENCIFVPILAADTGVAADVQQYRHELRITLDSKQIVVYPPTGTTATFLVLTSLTWDSEAANPRVPSGG